MQGNANVYQLSINIYFTGYSGNMMSKSSTLKYSQKLHPKIKLQSAAKKYEFIPDPTICHFLDTSTSTVRPKPPTVPPKWMSQERFDRIKSLTKFKTNMECHGCGQSFRGLLQSNGRVMIEMAYYMHVIQNCKSAKASVQQCAECDEKFHQYRGLRVHLEKTGHHRSKKVKRWAERRFRMSLRNNQQTVSYHEE